LIQLARRAVAPSSSFQSSSLQSKSSSCAGECGIAWPEDGPCLGSGTPAVPFAQNYSRCFRDGDSFCTENDQPTFNWIIGVIDDTQLKLQYVAAYALTGKQWQVIPSSSWVLPPNEPQDMNPNACSSWTYQPYPGGAAHWKLGFTPYGPDVKSPAPPGMMFAIKASGKVNTRWTFYVLNQLTLNVGAVCEKNPACQGATGNCWNQGGFEIDVIEGTGNDNIGYADGLACLNTQNPDARFGYGDQECMQGEGDTSASGFMQQRLFTEEDLENDEWDSPLLVVVIDKAGVTLYLNPTFGGGKQMDKSSTEPGDSLHLVPSGTPQRIWFTPVKATGQVADFLDTQQLKPPNEAQWGCGPQKGALLPGARDPSSPSGVGAVPWE